MTDEVLLEEKEAKRQIVRGNLVWNSYLEEFETERMEVPGPRSVASVPWRINKASVMVFFPSPPRYADFRFPDPVIMRLWAGNAIVLDRTAYHWRVEHLTAPHRLLFHQTEGDNPQVEIWPGVEGDMVVIRDLVLEHYTRIPEIHAEIQLKPSNEEAAEFGIKCAEVYTQNLARWKARD